MADSVAGSDGGDNQLAGCPSQPQHRVSQRQEAAVMAGSAVHEAEAPERAWAKGGDGGVESTQHALEMRAETGGEAGQRAQDDGEGTAHASELVDTEEEGKAEGGDAEDAEAEPVNAAHQHVGRPLDTRHSTSAGFHPSDVHFSNSRLSCLDFPAEDLAQQITLLDLDAFKSIVPQELKNCAWTGEEKHRNAPNVVRFTRRFNHTSYWVIQELLCPSNQQDRLKRLVHFIKVAKKLHEYNNLNGLLAIISALQSAPIYRLHGTWRLLKEKHSDRLERLEEFMSGDENHKAVRAHLQSTKLPCIPYLGLYLTDLMHLSTKNKSRSEQQQSEEEALLQRIARFQQSTYAFKVAGIVRDYLNAFSYREEDTRQIEKEQYQRSLGIEARTPEEPREEQEEHDDEPDASPSVLATVNARFANFRHRVKKNSSLPFRHVRHGGHRRVRSLGSAFLPASHGNPLEDTPLTSDTSSLEAHTSFLSERPAAEEEETESIVAKTPTKEGGRLFRTLLRYTSSSRTTQQQKPSSSSPRTMRTKRHSVHLDHLDSSTEAAAERSTTTDTRRGRQSSAHASHHEMPTRTVRFRVLDDDDDGDSTNQRWQQHNDGKAAEPWSGCVQRRSIASTHDVHGAFSHNSIFASSWQPDDGKSNSERARDDDDDDDDDDGDDDPFGVAAVLPSSRPGSADMLGSLPDDQQLLHEGVLRQRLSFPWRTDRFYWARLTSSALHLYRQASHMKGRFDRTAFKEYPHRTVLLHSFSVVVDPSTRHPSFQVSLRDGSQLKMYAMASEARDKWVHALSSLATGTRVLDPYEPA